MLTAAGLMRRVTSLQVGEVHVTLTEAPPEQAATGPRKRLSNLPPDEEKDVVDQEKEEDRKTRRNRDAHVAMYGPRVSDA